MSVELNRIAIDPLILDGRPYVKATRVTVGTIVGLFAAGHETARVCGLYPYIQEDNLRQALAYAAVRCSE